MKKKYIIPQSTIILLEPTHLMAGSLNAGDQSDPSLIQEVFNSDFTYSGDDFIDQFSEKESFLNFE